jgi:FAD/FMN-containing dehydrogenase
VVLSLARIGRGRDVDPTLGQVEVGAGATLAALQRRAADAGLDLAARDSATVGGLAAFDAGERARSGTPPHAHA